MNIRSGSSQSRWLSLLSNVYVWMGLALLAGVLLLLYVVVNDLVMPAYTRHGVAVEVPEVRRTPFAEAQQRLELEGFKVEKITRRYNPQIPQGLVVDQSPSPNALVKPGRRIYLTVNEGSRPKVRVPSLIGASLREAQNRIQAVGLRLGETRPDTIPSPYRNTVTQQSPSPGDSLAEGATITLWYSTGPSDTYELVPDVVGMTVREARQVLLENRLRALAVGSEGAEIERMTVLRQSREPGTRVRGGYEVRLFVTEE